MVLKTSEQKHEPFAIKRLWDGGEGSLEASPHGADTGLRTRARSQPVARIGAGDHEESKAAR